MLDVAVEDPGFVLGFLGFRDTDWASGLVRGVLGFGIQALGFV